MSEKAASRLDSLKGILKDSPKKLGLKTKSVSYEGAPVSFDYLPVRRSEVLEERHSRGFQPGPYGERSLRYSCNIVPRENTRNPRHSRTKSFPIHSQPFR